MKRTLMALAITLIAYPALATDFSSAIIGTEDKPLTTCVEKTPECEKPITLGRIAANALFQSFTDENGKPEQVSGDEKAHRGALAFLVVNGAKVDLPSEDVSLIKRLIGKAYGPLIVARAFSLLDPAYAPKQ